MTLITTRDDETHWAWQYEGPVKVLLNGSEIQYVTEADDVAGYVLLLATDENGDFIVNGDEVVTKRRSGVVQIIGCRREALF